MIPTPLAELLKARLAYDRDYDLVSIHVGVISRTEFGVRYLREERLKPIHEKLIALVEAAENQCACKFTTKYEGWTPIGATIDECLCCKALTELRQLLEARR